MSDSVVTRVSLIDARAPTRAFNPLRPRASDGTTDRTISPSEPAAEPDRYALGVAEGTRAATASFAIERAALLRLFASADALQPEPSEELAAMIATTVERLVTGLVGRMTVEHDWLAGRIERAITCIGEADAARTLWLHPDDAALLENADLPIDVQADASMERGALRIDCSQGWIEDSRSHHLIALRAALGIDCDAGMRP